MFIELRTANGVELINTALVRDVEPTPNAAYWGQIVHMADGQKFFVDRGQYVSVDSDGNLWVQGAAK